MVEEENFPRGGKFVRAPKRPAEDNLFSINTEQKRKKAKKAKRSQIDNLTDANFHSLLKIHGTLSYKEIQDGMLLLACVKHIHDFSIDIEMPGLTKGFVKITSISDPFTKYLNKVLEEDGGEPNILENIFKIGQFVLVKVLQVESSDKTGKLECSLNPREINSEKSHVSLKKGLLVWGCINSVLDHGYEVNIGVKNCRVFLPSKNVDEGKTFVIGEPLWLAVHKCDVTSAAATLRVSAKEQHLKSNKVDDIDSLHDLLPGMQVEMLTEKITATGIQGKFLNDYFGYIDETQLKYPLKKTDDYKEGKLISAYVMYVESSTKVTHLTMRTLEPQLELAHRIGDVVSGEVISKRHNGIYLKLPHNEKCFISNKRLIASLPHKPNEDITELIRAKFDVGSKHTCRILDYWPFARIYVCTTEKAIVKERIFNNQDLHPGDLVDVTVERIKTEGLDVSCGRVKGFVPNMFISNAEYSDNIKKKFKEGHKAKARVLEVKEGKNVLFTLKPGQVEADKCLTSLSEVKKGGNYVGVVVYTGPSGALMNFYGGTQGWLSKKLLYAGSAVDMTNFFYKGQVVNVWTLGTNENQVLLSMKPPSESTPSLTLEVGNIVNGYIGKIHEDRIDVTTKQGIFLGTIPTNHLSGSLSLCATFMDTFKKGEKINNLMCVGSNNTKYILSRKEGLLHRNKSYKLYKFDDLKPGHEIRCFYTSNAHEGIKVIPLILDFMEEVLIMKKDIVADSEEMPKFQKYQTVLAKIVKVQFATKTLQLTAKFDQVYKSRVEKATAFFTQHLFDVQYLKKFGLEHGWKLCAYSSGQRVSCIIDKVGKAGGCSVVLPNGSQGLVPPKLCPGNIQPGESIEGVFLDVDFQHGYAEICLKPEFCEKINPKQDGVITCPNLASCFAETILIKNDYVVCVLKQGDGNKQLVYCPIHLHENDWKGSIEYYEKNVMKLKLCICGMLQSSLIGMSKRLFMRLDKHNEFLGKYKKLHKQSKLQSEVSKEKNIDINNLKTDVGDRTESKKGKMKQVVQEKSQKKDQGIMQVDNDEVIEANSDSAAKSNEEVKKLIQKKKVEKEQKKTKKKDGKNKVDGNKIDIEDIDTVDGMSNCSDNEGEKSNIVLNKQNGNHKVLLPGVTSFFQKPVIQESSSSEDEDEQLETIKKKKKLTPAEKAELARLEEERISKIEKELADSTKPLESAEQFDRKLLGNPNSSELWTRYMSFHIASTEIDKARTVAKRALEAINMTLTEERLNIWLAILNLENMFGTKESFDKTFEDGIQYNDSLTIYLRSIEMLAESGKFIDMEEKIAKAKQKYKHDSKMWLEIAKVYYQINKFKDARNLKDAALKSIQDKKTQMLIIVRFAILEFKYGDEDHGAAIFETIISSDPKRVDIWSVYIDQLVKKNKIEQARRVLERAITQKLPLKNMKTLFLKYRRFEEEHGTPELVAAIKDKAVDYVNKALKK